MKAKLGVIGGMGPEATCRFYERVIAHTKADLDQEHIDMVVFSHASMPDRTTAIISGEKRALLEAFKEDLQAMEQLGIEHIAIPCNTSHYFLHEIQEMTEISIINMVEESARYVKSLFPLAKKVGIVGTNGTRTAGVYTKACEENGFEAVYPDPDVQKQVMSLIYDDIKGGTKGTPEKFEAAYQNLTEKGCEAIILACTEISVYKDNYGVPENCLDAMDVLVKESIVRAGGRYQ